MDTEEKQYKYEKALEYEIFINGEYDFSKDKIKDAKCIFDIWWHIWLFSKRCRTLNKNTKIHYFEPVKDFCDKAKLILWNDNNIILNNLWISSKTESWELLLNKEKTMQSSKYKSFLNPKWSKIVVNFISLKDYVERNDIDKIDVLKMDIEWMEFEVFESLSDSERKIIENLIVEVHILNDEMKLKWDQIFIKLNNIFWQVEIIKSRYSDDIFLLWCCMESWF